MKKYFFGKPISCPKCKTELDWWKALLRHLDWNFPSYLFAIVGGQDTSFLVDMKQGERLILSFEDVGVPKHAKILGVNYTANGEGLFPIELHGNSPIRHWTPHKVVLYGLPNGASVETTPVAVSVTWVMPSAVDHSLNNLVQGFSSYGVEQFELTVIPSNVSVEATLYRVMETFFKEFASNERVREFLENRATYSHQLNVLLPVACKLISFPVMPDHIRGLLNRLRDLRNELAHEGKLNKQLMKKDVAEMLVAAFFAVGYLQLLEEQLVKPR